MGMAMLGWLIALITVKEQLTKRNRQSKRAKNLIKMQLSANFQKLVAFAA